MQMSRLLFSSKRSLLAIALLLLFAVASCGRVELPELPTQPETDETLAVEAEAAEPETSNSGTETTVAESEAPDADSDKQAGVAAAADAAEAEAAEEVITEEAAEEVITEEAAEEVVAEAAPEEQAAPENVNWLTVTNRAEHELPAIGNPDAALTITEFSDFM